MYKPLFYSPNLEGLSLNVECNPGGGTSCPCSIDDVALEILETYGEVISNVRLRHTWANALVGKKYQEAWGDIPIHLTKMFLAFQTRMPTIPKPSTSQIFNAEQHDWNMTIYDGRNQFGRGSHRRIEASMFRKLNPWSPDGKRGKVFVATRNGNVDSGLVIPIDKKWHNVLMIADFDKEHYVQLAVDDNFVDLSDVPLFEKYSYDWGNDIASWATIEAVSTWPQSNCQYIFAWKQQYKNFIFGLII